jgi:hypothetical protein
MDHFQYRVPQTPYLRLGILFNKCLTYCFPQ